MRSIIGKIRKFAGRRYQRVEIDAGLPSHEEEFPDSAAEIFSEFWLKAMAQRREEMKLFMAHGAIAASDERAELLRALNHARRAIDACAPYAETVEAMSNPEFRDQINRLMVSLYGVLVRRPDADKSVWKAAGYYPTLQAALSNGSEDP